MTNDLMGVADLISLPAIALGVVFALVDHWFSGRVRPLGIPVVGVLAALAVLAAVQFGAFGERSDWRSISLIALEAYVAYFAMRLVLRAFARRSKETAQ